MKKLISIVFLFLFVFCTPKNEHQLPRIIVPKQKNVVEVNSKEMLNIEHFVPLAWDFNKDYKTKKYGFPFDGPSKGMTTPFDTIIPKYNLKIIIDTTYTFAFKGFLYKRMSLPKNTIRDGSMNGKVPTKEDEKNSLRITNAFQNQKDKLKNNYVDCYPLLIFNNSNKSILLNNEFIQEAKDDDGVWKPIEFTFVYEMCGTGKNYHNFLDSKKYFAYSIIKYNGDFKTKIRVKLKNFNNIYYSNEIDATINRTQFNQDFWKDFLERYDYNFNEKDYIFYKKNMFLND